MDWIQPLPIRMQVVCCIAGSSNSNQVNTGHIIIIGASAVGFLTQVSGMVTHFRAKLSMADSGVKLIASGHPQLHTATIHQCKTIMYAVLLITL